MTVYRRIALLSAAAVAAACCAGCGGGGGGGGTALTLSVTSPDLAGKAGQDISIPIDVAGTGTVTTAAFDLHFNAGVFGPVSGVVGDNSAAVDDTSQTYVCRYRWINAQTVRVMFASSDGVAAGSVLVHIPLKVLSESTSDLAIQNLVLTQ